MVNEELRNAGFASYEEWHKALGCRTCKYCNRRYLFVTGCCAYYKFSGEFREKKIIHGKCNIYEFGPNLDGILGLPVPLFIGNDE